MKNRFESRNHYVKARFGKWIGFLLFILVLFGFLFGIRSVSETTKQKQLESLETALSRNIVQCYAVEGMYPPNLEYLEEHYGLVYNKTLYFIDYQPQGSNILPEITVLPRTTKSDN